MQNSKTKQNNHCAYNQPVHFGFLHSIAYAEQVKNRESERVERERDAVMGQRTKRSKQNKQAIRRGKETKERFVFFFF